MPWHKACPRAGLRPDPGAGHRRSQANTRAIRIVNLRSHLAGPFELELDAGECLAITGPSGSGKSLFLRMVADLDPNQGEVFLDGVERRTLPAPAWRRKVVYSAAEPGWWHERVWRPFPRRSHGLRARDGPSARA